MPPYSGGRINSNFISNFHRSWFPLEPHPTATTIAWNTFPWGFSGSIMPPLVIVLAALLSTNTWLQLPQFILCSHTAATRRDLSSFLITQVDTTVYYITLHLLGWIYFFCSHGIMSGLNQFKVCCIAAGSQSAIEFCLCV